MRIVCSSFYSFEFDGVVLCLFCICMLLCKIKSIFKKETRPAKLTLFRVRKTLRFDFIVKESNISDVQLGVVRVAKK